VLREAPGAAWFLAADGAELHVYAETDECHAFFGDAPVPGFFVDDFAAAVRSLTEQGVEWLTDPEVADGRTWRHYRAPDGNVYEVMGLPATTDGEKRSGGRSLRCSNRSVRHCRSAGLRAARSAFR
jgi:hypothetical protein